MHILNLTLLASVVVSAAAHPIADSAKPVENHQDPYHRFTRWWDDNTNLGTFIGVPFGPPGIALGTKAWDEGEKAVTRWNAEQRNQRLKKYTSRF